MKFYKLVNNNWVETGCINNNYFSNIDRTAYKLGYVRVFSQINRRLTYNFYYMADCSKAVAGGNLTDLYYDRNRYLRNNGLEDESKYIYFSCNQKALDNYNNNELYNIYRLQRCEDCKKLYTYNNVIKVGRNHLYCNDCVNNHAKKCYVCGKWYMKASSLTGYDLIHDIHVDVCNHCKASFERSLHTCADCGGLTINARFIRNNWFCTDCYERHDVPNLINGYHDGRMPIVKQFATTETPKEDVFVAGTEIETECGNIEPRFVAYDVNEIMNKIKQLCKFERDGSLHHGVEIITQPGSIDWYYESAEMYKKMFETLNNYKCDYKTDYGTPTCGLHIHINRSFFKDYDYENRLCYLFQLLKEKIRIFSQRTRFDYCKFATGTTSWTNIYNQKLSQMQGHGSALNCSNRNTIEFRIFRGTTSHEMYMACLEFTRNFATLVRDVTDIAQIERTTFEDVINYCDNKYLNSYCQRLGLLGGGC